MTQPVRAATKIIALSENFCHDLHTKQKGRITCTRLELVLNDRRDKDDLFRMDQCSISGATPWAKPQEHSSEAKKPNAPARSEQAVELTRASKRAVKALDRKPSTARPRTQQTNAGVGGFL